MRLTIAEINEELLRKAWESAQATHAKTPEGMTWSLQRSHTGINDELHVTLHCHVKLTDKLIERWETK